MTYFNEWGFQTDPFITKPLPASQLGRTLLVGRDKELRDFVGLLRATSRIITLEGATGVGKTSLANVGAWVCYHQHTLDGVGSLFIPCNRSFQLHDGENFGYETFVTSVLMEVAQTLVQKRNELETHGRKSTGLESLDRWLNSSRVSGWQATLGVAGITGGFGKSGNTNTGGGFERAGFRNQVLTELSEIFPGGGGVVCIIDNMELLQTSAKAREMLENLRDELLHIPGLRWVLAGAGGIVGGVVSTPRLDGYLSDPIMIRGIDDQYAAEILRSRREAFALDSGAEAYLPLTLRCFTHLYHLLAGNIRSTLGRAGTYCTDCATEGQLPQTVADKEAHYLSWLSNHSRDLLNAVDAELTPRAWGIFDIAMAKFGGCFTPSSYADFGCKSSNTLSPHLRALEQSGMVASTREQKDMRRKIIEVTPKGYLVSYARQTGGSRLELADIVAPD